VKALLFVEASKLTDEVNDHLRATGVTVEPYEAVVPYVRRVAAEGRGKVWLDHDRSNYALYQVGIMSIMMGNTPARAVSSRRDKRRHACVPSARRRWGRPQRMVRRTRVPAVLWSLRPPPSRSSKLIQNDHVSYRD
jgi:hypothetical protein